MIAGIFAFVGAMIGAVFINYCLHYNNLNWEEPIVLEKKDD